MSRIIELFATLNLKEHPGGSLSVNGKVQVFREDDKVVIAVAEPQGTNHTILVMDLLINEGKLPMKGIEVPFFFELKDGIELFNQVTVREEDGNSKTVYIKVLG